MSNVLNEEKKQQAVALGRLGWSLRRIQKAIGVRRETVSAYLKATGVAMRAPRGQFKTGLPRPGCGACTSHGTSSTSVTRFWMTAEPRIPGQSEQC